MLIEFGFLYRSSVTRDQAVNILFDDLIPQALGTDLLTYVGAETADEFSSVIGKPLTNEMLKQTFSFMLNNQLVDVIDGTLTDIGLTSGLLKNFDWQPFKGNFTSILNDLTIESQINPIDKLKILGFAILPGSTQDERNLDIPLAELPSEDKKFAFFADQAYKPISERKNFEDWQYQEDKSSTEYAVYKNQNGEQILSLRGTKGLKDLITDIHIIKGSLEDSVRFNRDLSIAKELNNLVAVTGHSLGGAIANFISSELAVPAITFNAGFVTKQDIDFSMSKNYKIDNDPISLSLNKGKNFVLKPKKGTFQHSMQNFL